MNKKLFTLFLSLLFCCMIVNAQEGQKSELQQRAETEDARNNIAAARSLFIRAFDDYVGKGQIKLGVDCGTRATALYHKENFFKEGFELLRRVDQAISAEEQKGGTTMPALHYLVTKERLQMYIKMRNTARAMEQINTMENQAKTANDDNLMNDLLYNKAIYHYTFGQISATLIMSGWSVSSIITFMPERRIISCNWLLRSAIMPYLGMKVRSSIPRSLTPCGKILPMQ